MIKKKTKIPTRVTDEGWMEFPETAVWPSGEEERENFVSPSKALTRFSSL